MRNSLVPNLPTQPAWVIGAQHSKLCRDGHARRRERGSQHAPRPGLARTDHPNRDFPESLRRPGRSVCW